MQATEQIWLKKIECPLCYESFTTENIWQNKVVVLEEYPDLGKRYSGTNPLYYSVWVCPSCLYADFRGDEYFNTLKIVDEDFEEDYSIFKMVAEDADYKQPRTIDLAIKSYKLAILTGKHKRVSNARLGTFNLRLAWLYRSIKKTDQEEKYLRYTLDYYLQAYQGEDSPDFGNLSDGGITYLLGELYRRCGDLKTAVNFFQKVANDKELNAEPKYIKMARFQWESLKDNPNAQSDDKEEEQEGKE